MKKTRLIKNDIMTLKVRESVNLSYLIDMRSEFLNQQMNEHIGCVEAQRFRKIGIPLPGKHAKYDWVLWLKTGINDLMTTTHFIHQPSHNGQVRFWNMTTVISAGIRSQWCVPEIFLGSRFWATRQMWLFIITNMWLVLVIIIWLHLVSFFNSMTKMSWNVVLITWLPVVAEYDRDDYN